MQRLIRPPNQPANGISQLVRHPPNQTVGETSNNELAQGFDGMSTTAEAVGCRDVVRNVEGAIARSRRKVIAFIGYTVKLTLSVV